MPNSTQADERHAALEVWLHDLPSSLGLDQRSMIAASSDASFRHYWRIASHQSTLIVMDAPPPHEDCRPFLDVTKRLAAVGVTVPEVLAHDLQQGFMLLSDLGHQTFYDAITHGLPDPTLQTYYRQALDMLVRLQQANTIDLPVFDAPRLRTELELFEQWFVKQHHQVELTDAESGALEGIFERLCTQMAAEPRVLVHRDFHSPNLMVCESGGGLINPGVLDYQDAVAGPLSYDIASLVFDARTTWQEPQQLDWMIRYWEKARAAGLAVPHDFAVFHEQCEFTSLQRNLRILGVFARLNHRDGKSHYLAHLPRVLQYVRQVAGRYQAFAALARLLDRLEGTKPNVSLSFAP